jgi:hypothetical protein
MLLLAGLESRPVQADPASAPVPVVAVAATPTTDLEFARTAISRGDLTLAANHLMRELDRAPGNSDALPLLVQCTRTLADSACSRGDHMQAMDLVARADQRVAAARQDRYQPTAPIKSLEDITRAEETIQAIGVSINKSADEAAAPKISAAMQLADEAHHWYWWPNDRDGVREALRQLRWVKERGPALSKDTIGQYYQALDRLKGMVADSEWEKLLVEAGYVDKGQAH